MGFFSMFISFNLHQFGNFNWIRKGRYLVHIIFITFSLVMDSQHKGYFFLAKNLLFKVTVLAEKWGFFCLQRYINVYTADLTKKNVLILKQMYFSHTVSISLILVCLHVQNSCCSFRLPVNTNLLATISLFLYIVCMHIIPFLDSNRIFSFFCLSFYSIILSSFLFFSLIVYTPVVLQRAEIMRRVKNVLLIAQLFVD